MTNTYSTLYNKYKTIAKVGIATGLVALTAGCGTLAHLGDPWKVYSNGRWCPEYRDHPVRTTAILVGEAGAAALGVGAFSSGGSSKQTDPDADDDNGGSNSGGHHDGGGSGGDGGGSSASGD